MGKGVILCLEPPGVGNVVRETGSSKEGWSPLASSVRSRRYLFCVLTIGLLMR